jgi:hypothetical protein
MDRAGGEELHVLGVQLTPELARIREHLIDPVVIRIGGNEQSALFGGLVFATFFIEPPN